MKVKFKPKSDAQQPTPGATVRVSRIANMSPRSPSATAGEEVSFQWDATGLQVPQWCKATRITGLTTQAITYHVKKADLFSLPATVKRASGSSFYGLRLRDHAAIHGSLASQADMIQTVQVSYLLAMEQGGGSSSTWFLDPEVDLEIPCE